ncbi:sensor histidine kinase [Massilia endophytica]|uniref:sensor histidine kinase n=1 Tax=Massilia endophytica TaxID=2899220 RepID=UPI001E4F4816|nr:histidine kinase [Massilia endophytica]UGQ48120.1 histidine kinase [Massilia endophytica]
MWLLLTRRGLWLYLAVWSLLAPALGKIVALLAPSPVPNAMLFAVPGTMLYAVAAGFSTYYLCRANPLGGSKHPALVLLSLCASAALISLLWIGALQLWNGLCLSFGQSWTGIAISPQLSALLFTLGLLVYGLLAAMNYLLVEFARARNAEKRELEMKLMAQDAELRMLRTQIDPHFLFNSLNSISALTSQNPKGAREMTLQLASFFRQSLGMESHRKVTLEQEMALVRAFLGIEKVRFGERLVAEEAIEKGALECLVPPMIIQPLVENAVKHGISQLPEGGLLMVAAWRTGSVLRIAITNAIDPDMQAAGGTGIGLKNVRQRLAAAYEEQAGVHWEREGSLFKVELKLPAETEQGQ